MKHPICLLQAFSLLVLISIVSCAEDDPYSSTSNGENDFQETVSLIYETQRRFPLDTVTGFYHHSIQFSDTPEGQYFTIFNERRGRLYIYDYPTQSLVTTVDYELEGNHGVGPFYRMGHYYHNADSIFLYNYRKQILFLANLKGEVIKRYDVHPDFLAADAAYPNISTSTPMIFSDNKLHFIASSVDIQEDHTKLDMVFTLDLISGELTTGMSRPALYNEADWGISFKYKAFGCHNPVKDQFAYGFAIDPNIHVIDQAGRLEKHIASSKFFTSIPPFSKKKRTELYEDDRIKMHGFTTPNYYALSYDPYQDIYYRFVLLPLTEEEYNLPGGAPIRKLSVIVLDNNFQKIGETELGDRNYFPNFFISPEGLMIADLNAYAEEEDQLTYNVYKIKRIS